MQPKELSDLDIMLSTDVSHLMPDKKDIPAEFYRRNKWAKIVSGWFFKGMDSKTLKPKDGINKSMAIRHLSAIMNSFEPSHEDKIASVAYLMSLWLDVD